MMLNQTVKTAKARLRLLVSDEKMVPFIVGPVSPQRPLSAAYTFALQVFSVAKAIEVISQSKSFPQPYCVFVHSVILHTSAALWITSTLPAASASSLSR
jgi:hypothetical protein